MLMILACATFVPWFVGRKSAFRSHDARLVFIDACACCFLGQTVFRLMLMMLARAVLLVNRFSG